MSVGALRPRAVVLAFVGLAAVVNLDILLGPYGLVRFHDLFDNVFFHEYFQAREFLAHGLSFWSDKLGGLPSFVGLYPPYGPLTLFSLVLPPWLLSRAFDAGAMIVSGYGLYRLLSDYLGADRRAALLASVPFALTGYAYQSLTFFNYFPLFFMLFVDVTKPGSWRYRLPRAFGLVFLAYCSMPVVTLPVYSVLHLLLVLLFDATPWRRRRIAGTFLLWTGYALFFAPTLLSLLSYAPLSNRILAAPKAIGLVQLIAGLKDTYGYVLNVCIPLTAGFYFALEARSSQLTRKALFLCLGLAAAIQLSSEAVRPLFGHTPLKYVDFYHFSGPLMVAVPLLVGLGASHLLRTGAGVSWKRAVASLVLTGFLLSTDNLLLKACLLLFILGGLAAVQASCQKAGQTKGPGRLRLAAALCGLGLAAGVTQMHTVLMMDHSFVPYAKGFGHHQSLLALAREQVGEPFRVAGINLSPAVAQSHGLETADLLTQIYSKQYRDYFEAIVAPQLDTEQKRANYPGTAYREVFLVPPRDSFTTRRDLVYSKNVQTRAEMWNLPLLAAMNVRYLLSPRPVEGLASCADLEVVDTGPGAPLSALEETRLDKIFRLPLYVYRLRGAFPRGWLVAGARVLPDEKSVRVALESETLSSLAQQVLMSAADADSLPAVFSRADASVLNAGPESLPLVQHSADRFVWAGVLTAPRLLVVSNNFHLGWRALVNGAEVPVLRANQAFQAVPLTEPGPVRIELAFHDPLVGKAHVLTLLGVLLMLSCAALQGGSGQSPLLKGESLPLAWAGAKGQAFRHALLWGLVGAGVLAALFALLRAVREPADSQRLVWFLLAKSAASGLLAAPLAGIMLHMLVGQEPKQKPGPQEP